MKNVYRKIKEIRELKGYKQKEVAEFLGLEQSSYNKIENGKTALTIENLQKIADFLGVSIKEILFNEQSSQTEIEKDRKIRELEKENELLKIENNEIKVLLEISIILYKEINKKELVKALNKVPQEKIKELINSGLSEKTQLQFGILFLFLGLIEYITQEKEDK